MKIQMSLMRAIRLAVMLVVTVVLANPVLAQTPDCSALKDAVGSKLHAQGERGHALASVDGKTPSTGSIVDLCRGEGRQLANGHNSGREQGDHRKSGSKKNAYESSFKSADAKGFVNVWELRKALVALAALPTGQYDCGSEGDETIEAPRFKSKKARMAYARQLAKLERQQHIADVQCDQTRIKTENAFNKARETLNRNWLPVLVKATSIGDPVAEVILRLCEVAPALDRHRIASDCSESHADQLIAKTRLEAIDFKPALHKYAATNHAETIRVTNKPCGPETTEAGNDCLLSAAAERYRRILKVMETGYVGVAESWNTCQTAGANTKQEALVQECQRLMYLMLAVSSEVPRFYSAGPLDSHIDHINELTLIRPLLSGQKGEPTSSHLFASRGEIVKVNFAKFSDPEFQVKFYSALAQALKAIDSNIENDLRKEPRWSVFLIERINGGLYQAADEKGRNAVGKPTQASIAAYEAQTPQSIAARRAEQIERWRAASSKVLIDSLRESRNEHLWYSVENFPANLSELNRRQGTAAELVAAYYADKSDGIFRFNLIMLLSQKLKMRQIDPVDMEFVGTCLIDALKDASAEVRREAVYGLRFMRGKKYEAAANSYAG